jgi:formylglycine-generating enzyme required for sulfatase activity
MASGKLERARELDALGGSFLTSAICDALTVRRRNADKDQDGRVSLQELYDWVEEQACVHNANCPDRLVPYPSLFGKQRGELFLTTSAFDKLFEFEWPDGGTMLVLPANDSEYSSLAWCISKYPVTNAQYKRYMNATMSAEEPFGKDFVVSDSGERSDWQGGFYPWHDARFNDDDAPVVCVSYYNAQSYCAWVDSLLRKRQMLHCAMLPTAALWDFAAFGTVHPRRESGLRLQQSKVIHHRSTGPASIKCSSDRSNMIGAVDMIGNVWEWCGIVREGRRRASDFSLISGGELYRDHSVELRGGGFLDDLSLVRPFAHVSMLRDRLLTRHSDLGFRVAGCLPERELPDYVRAALPFCERFDFDYHDLRALLMRSTG